MSTTCCTNHCSVCNLHFRSVLAFDRHRIGDYASNDPETARRCAHPLDRVDRRGMAMFELVTSDGVCRIYPPEQTGVQIWTLAGSHDRGMALRTNPIAAKPLRGPTEPLTSPEP